MPYDYNLRRMFRDNDTLISAENLVIDSDNITNRGCDIMFKNCRNLVIGCRLPAMNLSERAYANMYEGCINLEIGSDLPALNVTTTYCYNAMYANCNKLQYLKAMLLTPNNDNSENAITGNWLLNVASNGVFVKNSVATWDVRGVHGVPEGWDLYFYDEENDRFIVRFTVNNIPCEMYIDEPKDVSWFEFLESEQNTNGFYTVLNSQLNARVVMSNDEYVLLNGALVKQDDKIELNASYTIGQPTQITEE